ncbi:MULTISPECIES: hypothetical protein [unclassified Diaminobutyricimonas]|uniref:hypothetical protein n=1 Tax=unclassified Diaminobutyricimonas TaxID=2643261 RepID=UPI0012F4A92C|nr:MULTISPECIES: hypothetical protein [unclassified Diaminobutyricimonas]
MTAEAVFDELAEELEPSGATPGKMFGARGIIFKKKAFVCLVQEHLAFKLGAGTDAHATALALPGAELWDPSGMGRPFKDWVAIPATDAESLTPLAEAALAYLQSTLPAT